MRTLTACLFFTLLLAACAGGPAVHPGFGSVTPEELRRGYRIEGDTIVFAFDPAFMRLALKREGIKPGEITSARVAASFTLWKQRQEWNMQRLAGEPAWILRRPLAEIMIPGNSGRPEFAFCVERKGTKSVAWIKPQADVSFSDKVSDQHTGQFNFVVRVAGDDGKQIETINQLILNPRTQQLTDAMLLSNFRNVMAGKLRPGRLYRSYHPFTVSKAGAQEKKRVATALSLMEQHRINAVINLTDTKAIAGRTDIPPYYKTMLDSGRVLLAATEYNLVYFQSKSAAFGRLIASVGRFVIRQEPPYLVHCRLGTDRTGVVTAILAGLAGATWGELRTDYQKTNNARFGEYRDSALLRYSLEQLLGIRLADDTTIAAPLKAWLLREKVLSAAEIAALEARLTR